MVKLNGTTWPKACSAAGYEKNTSAPISTSVVHIFDRSVFTIRLNDRIKQMIHTKNVGGFLPRLRSSGLDLSNGSVNCKAIAVPENHQSHKIFL
jgi:hypothetical protein